MRLIYLFLVLVLINFSPFRANAQDFGNPNSQKPIKLEISSTIPDFSENFNYLRIQKNEDNWKKYADEPNIHYTVRYTGFQGIIFDQLKRLATKYCNQFSDRYGNRPTYQSEVQNIINKNHIIDERWSLKNFYDCFPVEKGGVSYEEYIIGKDISVLDVGPLNLRNNGKLSLDQWWFDVSSSKPETISSTTKLTPAENLVANAADLNRRHLMFGINPPISSLLKNNYFIITGNIRLNLRVDQLNQDNKSGITVIIKTIILYQKKSFLELQVKAYSRPFIHEYGAEFSAKLLTF